MEPLIFSASVVEQDVPQNKQLRVMLRALDNPGITDVLPATDHYELVFRLSYINALGEPKNDPIMPLSGDASIRQSDFIEYRFNTTDQQPWTLGTHTLTIEVKRSFNNATAVSFDPPITIPLQFFMQPPPPAATTVVSLSQYTAPDTSDELLWEAIKASRIEFKPLFNFAKDVLCAPGVVGPDSAFSNRLPFVRTGEYSALNFTVEAYMMAMSNPEAIPDLGNYLVSNANLAGKNVMPYFNLVLEKLSDIKFTEKDYNNSACFQRLVANASSFSLFELIWNYWMEQAGLVQTMNAISMRYQNIKRTPDLEPLYRLDTDTLRPVSNLVWGYIQNEQHTLSLNRRSFEYGHAYGLTLIGKAVPTTQGVDNRSKFLEAFHNLLHKSAIYFKQSDDTTIIPDGFPVLNALREVHLLLAEGFHNAYANLTWTARHEMIVQQILLAQPEMREFLGGRIMVPYAEPWMPQVETVRGMMGWGDSSVSYFWELASYGELILLSARFGNWSVAINPNQARNWASSFRDMIMRYIHAYRVVTGVDLSADTTQLQEAHFAQPARLIQQRVATARGNGQNGQRNGLSRRAAEMV